jgi:septum formation protein
MRSIILASGSPRRQELLKLMGLKFEVRVSNYDEYIDNTLPAKELSIELALGKARVIAERNPEALVIGGDTLVTLNGEHLGKAPDVATARQMLRALDGQTASVTSSVVLLCRAAGLELTDADTTVLHTAPTDNATIEAYLQTNDWRDKAGAWGIQSGGSFLFNSIEGAYDTILGLPTEFLARMLEKQAVKTIPVHLASPVPQK